MVLNKASKIDLIRSFGGLTLSKILESGYPTLGALKRVHGIERIETITSILFLDLNSSFGDELSPEHVQEISAELTSSNLINLSLEDIYFVCRLIKTSENYGKLTVNKVLKTLSSHFEKRIKKAGEISLNSHLSQKVRDDNRAQKLEQTKDVFRKVKIQYLQEQSKRKANEKEKGNIK